MPNSNYKSKGGKFLLDKILDTKIFTPEDLSFEQKQLGELAAKFSGREVFSQAEKIENGDHEIVVKLMQEAGKNGLLMAEIPEPYGGLGLDKASSTIIAENITHQGSFSVSIMCHTGIGTLPILYYGNEDQKTRYLPKLATGEMIGAYALTEAGAGTDAMAISTKAKLSEDKKHYILNGEKQFCTNGGIADLITIFAKDDENKITAFLVEKNFEGISIGKEEDKMGIRGSSTTPITFNNAKVPSENVLGEKGKGHKIAFNVLNIGRWKLGCASVGDMKRLIEISTAYANQRQQFGKPIASFELIKQKIAKSVILTYLAESQTYRLAGNLDEQSSEDIKTVLEDFSVEASINKVFCSEALQYVADQAVQIHGGYGFIRDYPVEHHYRNCRVNRIFEGTNEINRLIIIQTLLKRSFAGKLDIMSRLQEILVQLKTGFPKTSKTPNNMELWIDQVERLKILAIYTAGVAAQKLMNDLENHQAILGSIADIIINAYALESGLIRAIIASNNNNPNTSMYFSIIKAAIAEKVPLLNILAKQVLINIVKAEEKETKPLRKAHKIITDLKVMTDTDALYKTIADKALELEKYIF